MPARYLSVSWMGKLGGESNDRGGLHGLSWILNSVSVIIGRWNSKLSALIGEGKVVSGWQDAQQCVRRVFFSEFAPRNIMM